MDVVVARAAVLVEAEVAPAARRQDRHGRVRVALAALEVEVPAVQREADGLVPERGGAGHARLEEALAVDHREVLAVVVAVAQRAARSAVLAEHAVEAAAVLELAADLRVAGEAGAGHAPE